jgi:hypothetical protein
LDVFFLLFCASLEVAIAFSYILNWFYTIRGMILPALVHHSLYAAPRLVDEVQQNLPRHRDEEGMLLCAVAPWTPDIS